MGNVIRLAMRRLTAATLAVLLGACGGPGPSIAPSQTPTVTEVAVVPSPSAEPSDSPLPTVAPTPNPTPTTEPTQDPDPCSNRGYDGPWAIEALLPGSAVQVTVDELHLRAGPCTAAKRIKTLKKGDILIVGEGAYGPLKGNGFPWYSVVLPERSGPDGGLPALPEAPIPPLWSFEGVRGWIAANDGVIRYVTQVAPRCPTTINLEMVEGMLPAERLACFDGPIVLEGTFGCGGCGGTGGPSVMPQWLAGGGYFPNLRTHWGDNERPITIYFKPSGPAQPREGRIIRVTLHVDDAASQRCKVRWTLEEPEVTAPDEIAIPYCRERFVVDSYKVLGKDPDYFN